jgi:hypothetical protein
MHHTLHIADADLKDKSPLARNAFLKLIGVSLVGLFLPAILWFEYKLPLSQIFILEALFWFFMMLHLWTWSLKLTARHGTVAVMLLGILCFILNFGVLYLAKSVPQLIYLSPFFAAMYCALFRSGYHTTMMQGVNQDKHFGIHQVTIESAGIIAGLIGPILWGIVADTMGSSYLYLLAVICLSLSCVPLLFHQRHHKSTVYDAPSLKRCLHMLQTPEKKAIFLTFSTLWYIDFVANIVWPIILFSLLHTYTKVAIVSFLSTLIVLGIMWFIGKKSDAKQSKQLFLEKRIHYSFWGQWSVRLVAGLTLIGGFFSQMVFVLIDSLHKITHRANHTYVMTQWYKISWSEGIMHNTLDMIYFRELAIHSIKCVACLLLACIASFFPDTLWWLILPLFWVSLLIFFSIHTLTLRNQIDIS